MRVRVDKMMNMMATLSLDEEKEKHICGRIAYGGNFNPMGIAHEIEQRQEVIDFANYSDMQEFCKWKEDPVSFDEYLSQYMQ